jgi:hypothetical protein
VNLTAVSHERKSRRVRLCSKVESNLCSIGTEQAAVVAVFHFQRSHRDRTNERQFLVFAANRGWRPHKLLMQSDHTAAPTPADESIDAQRSHHMLIDALEVCIMNEHG